MNLYLDGPDFARYKHEVAILSDFMSGGWHADCSCGWSGPERQEMRQAARDADEHKKEA